MSLSSDNPIHNLHAATQFAPIRAQAPGLGDNREDESLHNVLRVLKRWRRFILYSGLAMLAAGILACIVMHPEYRATATLLVDQSNSSGMSFGDMSSLMSALGVDNTKMEIDTASQELQSDTTALMVVKQFGFDKKAPYAYDPNEFHLNPYDWNPALKTEIGKPIEDAPATRERILRQIDKRLKVEPSEGTRLINVTYTDQDPQRAADVANAFVNLYIGEYLEDHFRATARASEWLTGQLSDLKARVDDSQQKLADYENKTGLSLLMLGMSTSNGSSGSSNGGGISMMGGGTQLPAVNRLAMLNSELTAAQADTIAKEAIYHLTQTESPEVVLGLGSSSLASVGTSSSVLSSNGGLALLQLLRQQQATAQQAYSDALTKYGPKNPRLMELQGQLDGINKSIEAELGRIRQRAKNDVDLAHKAEASIRTAYNASLADVNKLNSSSIQLEILADQALSNRELYKMLKAKLQEANIEAGVQATNLDLVDQARAPAVPYSPNWLLYPPIGLLIGLVLGCVGAFVRESLDDSIVTAEEVERVGSLPVLSYLPLVRGNEPGSRAKLASVASAAEGQTELSPLLTKPKAPESEAYRSLRTSIQLSTVDSSLRTLVVTSPMGGDGKTTVSYNTAISFALHDQRVLLVDADMRKPKQHLMFGVNKSPGLSGVLTGGVSLEDAITPHRAISSLYLLPAGATPPNPAELLNSRRLEAVLDEAKGKFDYVIFDSPPVLLVTDSVIISTKVDGVIVVVRSRKTTRLVLKRAAELLAQSRGRKLGFVVNGVDTKSVEYYYAYGYYGDGKYYGEEA